MGHPVLKEPPFDEGDDCEHCEPGETPANICVRIRGLAKECIKRPPDKSFSSFDVAEAINNVTYTVPQIEPCRWFDHFCGDYGRVVLYSVLECQEGQEEIETDILGISIDVIKINATQIRIRVKFEYECGVETGAHIFFAQAVPVQKHCVQVSNVPNEQTLNSPTGGTLSIKEGPCP